MNNDLMGYVTSVLKTTPSRWLTLASTLPDDLLRRPPAIGEWPASDCLYHLYSTELYVFPYRVRLFLEGRDFPAYDPDQEEAQREDMPLAQLAEEFARLRAGSLGLLATVRDEDLDLRVRHSDLGPVSLREMLHEWAAHDLMHTVQAERALMQAFLPGTGPWREFFADHDVERARTVSNPG
ncbi:MAG TPA: DinB family protein [Chloroflexia bacterium]|nr:DinB family protein [Chloroflexia bacterium]